MNCGSIKNQVIIEKFVNREVLACISDIAEHLFSLDGYGYASYDDLDNFYQKECSECGAGENDIELMDDTPAPIKTETGWECPICGSEYKSDDYESDDDAKEHATDCCECYDENDFYKCFCGKIYTEDEFNNLDTNPQEVYEWWLVTPWLGGKLKDHGEVVFERWGGWIWGRGCTGQAISMDGVINDICSGMCILEGQKHDWSAKI